MDVIEMTRKLGQAIQEDERYKAYMEACSINDTDVEIQNKIGEFNQLRSQLSVEMQKPDKDGEKMTALDTQIRELYDEIMAMPKMIAFNEAKEVMDKLLPRLPESEDHFRLGRIISIGICAWINI